MSELERERERERENRVENEVRDTNEKERGMEWNGINQIKSNRSFHFIHSERTHNTTLLF